MPLLGVGLLAIVQSLSWQSVRAGIVGDDAIKPYSILTLFMALAYISVAVDKTGVFAWMALTLGKKASSSRALFFVYFAFSGVMTPFTSNDIVIMTLTPIILHFAIATKSDPVPMLFGQFYAANMFSMALYVGNPTNIIVAQVRAVGTAALRAGCASVWSRLYKSQHVDIVWLSVRSCWCLNAHFLDVSGRPRDVCVCVCPELHPAVATSLLCDDRSRGRL